MKYAIEEVEEFNYEDMSAPELADYCLNLFEQIGRERKKRIKTMLIHKYNAAAKYYNDNINKVMKLC